MQRLITEGAANPHRVEAATTVLTYGRRMASTMSAIAESRTTGGVASSQVAIAPLAAQLDALIASLDGSAAKSATAPPSDGSMSVPVITDVATADAAAAPATQSLQSAQLERLRAQLAVMERAVARYQAA